MRAFFATSICTILLFLCGCETNIPLLVPSINAGSNAEIEAPRPPALQAATETELDDCSRYLVRVDGSLICFDGLIQEILGSTQRDNDGDGIPNISDEDIDGDGIPNGYDLDTDGDGVPNSIDDDIDDDGVTNEGDVDIDGDFLRNRWDIDMDGDLLFNPRDNDADGDGKLKAAPIVNFPCGPVALFNDPKACGAPQDCDEDGDNNNGGASNEGTPPQGENASQEDDCLDKGSATRARAGSDGRNAPMIEIIEADMMNDEDPMLDEISATEFDVLEADIASVVSESDTSLADLEDVEPDASRSERADSVIAQLEAAIDPEGEDVGGSLSDSLSETDLMTYRERQTAVVQLAELPEVSLDEANDLTDRLAAAVTELNARLLDLVNVTETVDASFADTAFSEDAATAVAFVETAEANAIGVAQVSPAIPATARTLSTIGNQETAEAVWRITVEQAAAYRNEDDSFDFSLVAVARVVERVATLLDDPSLEAVNAASGALLAATSDNDLSDPLAVLDRLIDRAENDPALSLADGISTAEANAAAEDLATNP